MRIGILWRAEWDPVVEGRPIAEKSKLHPGADGPSNDFGAGAVELGGKNARGY